MNASIKNKRSVHPSPPSLHRRSNFSAVDPGVPCAAVCQVTGLTDNFYFRGSIVPATASSTLFMIGCREPSRQYSPRHTEKALPRLRTHAYQGYPLPCTPPCTPCALTLYPVAKNRSSTWTGRVFPRTSFGYRADEPGLLKRQGMNSNTRASLNDRLTQRQPDLSPFPTPASRAYHGSTKSMCRLHAVDPVRHFNLPHVASGQSPYNRPGAGKNTVSIAGTEAEPCGHCSAASQNRILFQFQLCLG